MSKVKKDDIERIAQEYATIILVNLPPDYDDRKRVITAGLTSALYKLIDILRKGEK